MQASGNATALTITPRLLTLVASNMTIAQGAALPTTDTAYDGWVSTGPNSTNGLVNGDTVSSVTVATNATASSGPGGYALTGSNAVFGSGSAANYTISYYTSPYALTIH